MEEYNLFILNKEFLERTSFVDNEDLLNQLMVIDEEFIEEDNDYNS